ncbi:uncharacterized protein LOC129187291 isoform X2 [Dunckerocampus dactyliophorus]|uniref:uncharacterized protein LOC129187291 isoform X2 n=1 Tax=Dunckerocampus dactyliophorus TaxID=161453 RepID=UPI002404DB96|nr:uncharacterized protein LOC129187291 isoform X2 [Dunckerocampus dactyliophorus]
MAFQISPNIDSLLCQLVIEVRELSVKKTQIDRQIEVCKADIAERRTDNQRTRKNIDNLDEDIELKQNTLKHNRAVAKSMKATQALLLQYERTLITELESVKVNYSNDKEVYAEKIASYSKLLQSHEKPFAQKLKAYNVDMDSRIKACHDQVTIKAKEGGHLTDTSPSSSSSKKPADSDPEQLPTAELDKETENVSVDDSATVITSVSLDEIKKRWQSGPEAAADGNIEEMDTEREAQEWPSCSADETRSNKQIVRLNPQTEESTEMHHKEAEDQETGTVSTAKKAAVSEVVEGAEEEMEERTAEQEQDPANEGNGDQVTLHEVPHPPSSSALAGTVPVTPMLRFNFSPACSPIQETSDTKSPAFTFSLNSNPCTPGFSSFGFDVVSSCDEDLSFPFGSSVFSEKENVEPQSGGLDFLFKQTEQSEDFQFAFASKSPAASKAKTMDEFPFSFNF